MLQIPNTFYSLLGFLDETVWLGGGCFLFQGGDIGFEGVCAMGLGGHWRLTGFRARVSFGAEVSVSQDKGIPI